MIPEYIDIPSKQLIPEFEKGMKDLIKQSSVPGMDIEISKIKWTAEGLRVWIKMEKIND